MPPGRRDGTWALGDRWSGREWTGWEPHPLAEEWDWSPGLPQVYGCLPLAWTLAPCSGAAARRAEQPSQKLEGLNR